MLYEFTSLRLAFGLAGARLREEGSHNEAEGDETRFSNADALFETIDTDGSGEIDKSEFSAHLSKSGFSRVTIAHIFDVLDVNSDGAISREELRRSFVQYEYAALRLALGIKPKQ